MIAFYINEVSAVAVVSQKSFLYILIYLVSCRVLITKTDAKSNYANHTNGKKRSYKNKNNNNNIKLGEKDDRIFFYIMICDTRKERIKRKKFHEVLKSSSYLYYCGVRSRRDPGRTKPFISIISEIRCGFPSF